MKDTPHCYGRRRLNPYAGMIQVVDAGDARALSPNGRHWEIQVLAARPEHDWRSPNVGAPVMQFFRFGVWAADSGLRQVPVSPILDLDALLQGSAALCRILPGCLQRLPFPAGDLVELWLLDRDRQPLVLLDSVQNASHAIEAHPQPWSAAPLSEHGFISPQLLELGIPARDGHNPRVHASRLERLVRTTAGSPPHRVWIQRSKDGSGSRPDGSQQWQASDFPPLGLREDWPDAADSALAHDYLNWCAPHLLTFSGLTETTRRRLERAACSRALLVESQHRLYPRILETELIEAARVEARLRSSA